jgi:hypothetical protein
LKRIGFFGVQALTAVFGDERLAPKRRVQALTVVLGRRLALKGGFRLSQLF